jgi:hypothetical protein
VALSEGSAPDTPGELVAPAFEVAERADASAAHVEPSTPEHVARDSEALPAMVLPPDEAAARPPVALVAAAHAAANGVARGLANGVAHAGTSSEPAAPAVPRSATGAEPPSVAAPPSAPEALVAVPGLVLIESEQRQRFLYWELGAAGSGACWLHVVSHTPAADGHTERRERRFLVQQRCGALRIEGVPRDAVVRAKLSEDPDGRPVAVAGAVRSFDAELEIQFCPHPRAPLEAIARRAQPVLARATPLYWD